MSDDPAVHDDFKPRMNWGLWRKVLVFARPHRASLAAMAAVAVVTAACDVVVPLLTGGIIDEVTQHGAQARVAAYGVGFAIVTVTFTLCVFSMITLAGRIVSEVCYDIRRASFSRLQDLSFSYFDRRPVGWLMARLTSDCNGLSRIIGWALIDIVWAPCVLLGIIGAMLWLNWKLALVVLVVVPPLVVACRYFQGHLLLTSRAMRKANSHVTAGFNEGIMGIRTSKALVRESQNLAEFRTLSTEMYEDSMRNALYAAAFVPFVLTLCSAGVGLALWFGGVRVIGGSITIGMLVVFISYATQFSNPIEELARTITMIQGAQASAERIQQLLDTEPEIADAPHVLSALEHHRNEAPIAGRAPDGLPDRIEQVEFRHTSFEYKQGRPVLDDFNLRVKAGETIALVGPTGGGKSTIVNLMCRFYEPTRGQILINDVEYRQRSLHWLQSNLGIVLQTPHLFSGTVRDNIRYGKLDASNEQIEHAAALVNAHGFIAQMTDGFEAEVGEGGNRLSIGQKQLISLARAILAAPQIFVMDEATSSVDTQTEKLIQEGLNRVLAERIAFVIAHRLSTIRAADRILVIEGGRIVEAGDHDALIQRRGHYHDLYTHQFTDERGSALLQDTAAPAS